MHSDSGRDGARDSDGIGVIGVIGVGNMGLGIVVRLRSLGRPVRVRDIDPERERLAAGHGARAFATPARLAADCAAVIVAVVDAAQAADVLFGADGAAPALRPGACVLLCPTIDPASVEAIAARLAAIGIDAVDAPMSGGPARAASGTMSLMVACADALFTRHRPLLEAIADPVFRVGTRPGDGARTKLVNNLLAAINLAGAAEALALAERVGLDPARTLDVIERSSGQSWIGSDRLRRAIAGDYAPRAHATLLAKDSSLAVGMAQEAGAQTRLGALAAATFAEAVRAGHGALDDAVLFDLLRAKERQIG
ncbi:MAG: NAD(P)-dependent oxidoreductase [Caldimonas sp.]